MSYLLLHKKVSQNVSGLKQQWLSSRIFSGSGTSRVAQLCGSDSVCHELCSECQLTSPEGLAGAGRATSSLTHVAVGRWLQFSPMQVCSCPQDMAAGFPQNAKLRENTARKSQAFMNQSRNLRFSYSLKVKGSPAHTP